MLSFLPSAAIRRRLITTASCAALAATMCASAPAPAAVLGKYAVQACSDGDLLGLPVADDFGGWINESSDADPSHTARNDCAGPDGLLMQLSGADRKAPNDYVAWKFVAPAYTTLTDAYVTYDAYTRPYNGHTQGGFAVTANGVTGNLTAYRGAGLTDTRVGEYHGLEARWLKAAVSCLSSDGADCPTGQDAMATIERSVMYLADDLQPFVPEADGSAIDDGSWRDVEHLTFSSTDLGSGIAEFRWYVDGEVVLRDTPDDNDGACIPDSVDGDVPMYHAPRPCPATLTVTEDLDTTDLDDGPHDMRLVVADASGWETDIFSGTKVIANHPPSNDLPPAFADAARAAAPHVGEELVATRGTWSGPELTYAVAWERCEDDGSGCAQIPGATVESYAPTAADLGKRLRMAVMATNPADSVTAWTPMTAAVAAAPAPSGGSTGGGTTGGGTTGGGTTGGGTTGGGTTGGGTTGGGTTGGGTTTGGTTTGGTTSAPTPPTGTTSGPVPEPPHVLVGRVAGEPSTATCPEDRATLVLQGVAGHTVKLGYGRSGRAAVLLTCTATGKAIANARLDVATRVGSKPAVASQITTDASGRATLSLSRGASRAITVGYRMYADDPLARATVTLRVAVRGRVSLRASRRALRNGQAVRLSGALAGGRVPRRGVDLAVQWRDGRRWRPFAQVRTDRRGRFHYAYRFTRTHGAVRYALRVQVVKGQVDYPYAPAASKAVRVVVRS